MVYRRCPSSDHPEGEDRFYEKRLGACPACGTGAATFNPALKMAQLNNHLMSQVDRQHTEADFAKRARREREPFGG